LSPSLPLPTPTPCEYAGCSTCCGVLQCVAVCCSVLQGVAVCCSTLHHKLQCVAVYCSVLQYVLQCVPVRIAVCCSELQCVAGCCSMLQCVAVYCSPLVSVHTYCVHASSSYILHPHILCWLFLTHSCESFFFFGSLPLYTPIPSLPLSLSPFSHVPLLGCEGRLVKLRKRCMPTYTYNTCLYTCTYIHTHSHTHLC